MSRPLAGNAESRPSDFWAGSKTISIPRAGSAGPMRTKEVAPAPGAKTRSHLQLLQNTHRAATGGWTASSFHPPDSHMNHGIYRGGVSRENNENEAYPLQEDASSVAAFRDPSAPPLSHTMENNLREQRDLLASQVDLLRSSNQPRGGGPNHPVVAASLLPPLNAPYGSLCSAPQPPFAATGKYNTTYLGGQTGSGGSNGGAVTPLGGGGGGHPNRLGINPNLLNGTTGTKAGGLASRALSTSASAKKAKEEIESLQSAVEDKSQEMDHFRLENEQLRSELQEAQRVANDIASRHDSSEQRITAAQRAMDRAREMQRRAEVALEHQSETVDTIQQEAVMYRREWERCMVYMGKFGGIGKDFHNSHEGDNAVGLDQEALIEASRRNLAENEPTDENCAELVNRILQGDHSLIPPAGGKEDLYFVQNQNPVDPATVGSIVAVESGPPHRLVLGESPLGAESGGVSCGRLGLVTLSHRLLQEHANTVSQLKSSRERSHSLLVSLQHVHQREAQSAEQMVAMEGDFQLAQERIRVGEVLLADVRGEAEYLRGLVGEHTETISRLMREVATLQSRVREEVGQRAAAEGRVDAAEDTVKKATSDVNLQEMALRQTISEMERNAQCTAVRFAELEMARNATSQERDHLAHQLNHLRTVIAGKLDALVEEGSSCNSGEAARQAQEQASRESHRLTQTIAALRNELFADCPPPPPPPFNPAPQNHNVSCPCPNGNNNFTAHPTQPVDYRSPHHDPSAPQPQHSHHQTMHHATQFTNKNVPNLQRAPGLALYHGPMLKPKDEAEPDATVALKEATASKNLRMEAAAASSAATTQLQSKQSIVTATPPTSETV